MASTCNPNVRIAKNTVMLYMRMTLLLLIALYTSRVILRILGVEDFGIYNVVGGMVMLFTFINSAMQSATQRFLNYEMGRGAIGQLNTVFKTAYIIHLLLAVLIVLFCETLGLWLLMYKLQIPAERFDAAFLVFHISVCTCVLQIITLPYTAVIIAHERINAYACITIVEGLMKLGIVFLLTVITWDKLKCYAILLIAVQCVISGIYFFYCHTHFREVQGRLHCDRRLWKEMTSFAGWCTVGCMAGMMYTQGLNVLLGIFFTPVINAARGIAIQIQSAVGTFTTNLQTAVVPQLTQAYARDDYDYFFSLIYKSSKYTAFLIAMLSIPIMIRTHYILELWLGEVPSYTVVFIRLLLGITLLDALSFPLMRASDATGNIRKYHSIVGGILLAIVPIAYIVLKLGGSPTSVFVVQLSIANIALGARLVILRQRIQLSIRRFIIQVLWPVATVTSLTLLIVGLLSTQLNDHFGGFVVLCLCSAGIYIIGIATLGMTTSERLFVTSKIQGLISRRKDNAW